MDRAILEVGWSPRLDNGVFLGLCGRVLDAGAMLRTGGSGALGLAEVASGRIDGYFEKHINLWDCAAALVILGEAGAHVNDFLVVSQAAGGPVLACAPGLAGEFVGLMG